ncbi:MAG: hypothetical protein IH899_09095 [Planctomycetes bacterium]|nr:hypothetical protein [Planctomycetota bacterium]
MQQSQLERAVAQATGETRDTIRQRGFSLLEIPQTTEEDAACNALRCSAGSGNDRQQDEMDAHQFPSTHIADAERFVPW